MVEGISIKSITRSFTIAIEDSESRGVKSFFQVMAVADRCFIHSLIGKDTMRHLVGENFKKEIEDHGIRKIYFVMEPRTLKSFLRYWHNAKIEEETEISGKVCNWVVCEV